MAAPSLSALPFMSTVEILESCPEPDAPQHHTEIVTIVMFTELGGEAQSGRLYVDFSFVVFPSVM